MLSWNFAFVLKVFAAAKNSSSYWQIASGEKHFKSFSTQIALKNIHTCHDCAVKSSERVCSELALLPCPGCHLQISWLCGKLRALSRAMFCLSW